MTEDNCLNCEHYEQIRGNKYPKGICHQHFMTRKSDGFPVNLLIHGNDLFICKDYVRKESTKSRETELMNENIQLADKNAKLRASLYALLNAVDYTAGSCRLNDLVGAVLPYEFIKKAHEALK
jgi:hypothetical protein